MVSVLAALTLVATASACVPLYPQRLPPAPDAPPADTGAMEAAVVDSGPPIEMLNECASADFVDRSAPGADRNVYFGGEMGAPIFNFLPRCITIAVGQSVTFVGTFSGHPLSPGTGPATLDAGAPDNPIPRVGAGMSMPVAFPTAGVFPFFCEMHGAGGMHGVVQVR